MVSVPKLSLAFMQFHAEEDWPNEACGVAFGNTIASIPNRARNTRITYEFDSEIWIETYKKIVQVKQGWWGIYHSHPMSGAAIPSRRDIAHAPYEEAIYFIIPCANGVAGEVKAYRIKDGKAVEESIHEQTNDQHPLL